MSGGPQPSIVLRQFRIEAITVSVYSGLKPGMIEPRSARSFRDVFSCIPAVYFPAPQQLGYLPAKFDPAAAFRRSDSKATQM